MQESGGDMFKPHKCFVKRTVCSFDENRNPISDVMDVTEIKNCFLDFSSVDEPAFTQDGQIIRDAGAVIYADHSEVDLSLISVGNPISVFDKQSDKLLFNGAIKAFRRDIFHTRIWV